MWVAIAVILTIILETLVNCYIQKDAICGGKSLKDKVSVFFPRSPFYVLFLLLLFIMGITAFGVQYNYFSDYIRAAKFTTLLLLLAPIAFMDLKSKKIPDKLILTGICVRILFYVFEFFISIRSLQDILITDFTGVLLGGGLFLLAALIAKNSIGMGDVKMFAMIGVFCGFTLTFSSILYSMLLSFIASVILLILRKKGRKDTLPLAPFAFIGTYLAIILEG